MILKSSPGWRIWFQSLSSHSDNGNNLRSGLLASSLSLQSALHPYTHTHTHTHTSTHTCTPGFISNSVILKLYYLLCIRITQAELWKTVSWATAWECLIQQVWGRAPESAFQTNSQVMLKLLIGLLSMCYPVTLTLMKKEKFWWQWTYPQDLHPLQIAQPAVWSPLLCSGRQCRVAAKSTVKEVSGLPWPSG